MCKLLRCLKLLGIGLVLAATGCQTWEPQSGLTLPSGDYLNHAPQFIPPSPRFPLPKEMDSLEKATAAAAGAGVAPF